MQIQIAISLQQEQRQVIEHIQSVQYYLLVLLVMQNSKKIFEIKIPQEDQMQYFILKGIKSPIPECGVVLVK